MNKKLAQFIIRLTLSPWLPTIIGRRKFWHSLYYRAAEAVRRWSAQPKEKK